jgi:hypothetical protein
LVEYYDCEIPALRRQREKYIESLSSTIWINLKLVPEIGVPWTYLRHSFQPMQTL